jgi:hypothetical protein
LGSLLHSAGARKQGFSFSICPIILLVLPELDILRLRHGGTQVNFQLKGANYVISIRVATLNLFELH